MSQKIRIRIVTASFISILFLTSAISPAQPPQGSPKWKLSYAREYGQKLSEGVGSAQAELFATNEDGSYADIGMTNQYNANIAIFGKTGVPPADPYTPGNLRVTFDPNNAVYDFRVYDPGRPSDSSPNCYWRGNLLHRPYYRFEFWFRRVQDDGLWEFFPNQPVYHYDLVNGFNTSSQEPSGFLTDAFVLTNWANYQAQTFVVPPRINRIIGAKAFATQEPGRKFKMTFSIREGSPTGPQIGPSATSREIQSNEFPNVKVGWPMDAVPVVPGRTYAVRLEWPAGFNIYATAANNYPNGMLYNGGTAVPNRDMIAVVVGARKWEAPMQARQWELYKD